MSFLTICEKCCSQDIYVKVLSEIWLEYKCYACNATAKVGTEKPSVAFIKEFFDVN